MKKRRRDGWMYAQIDRDRWIGRDRQINSQLVSEELIDIRRPNQPAHTLSFLHHSYTCANSLSHTSAHPLFFSVSLTRSLIHTPSLSLPTPSPSRPLPPALSLPLFPPPSQVYIEALRTMHINTIAALELPASTSVSIEELLNELAKLLEGGKHLKRSQIFYLYFVFLICNAKLTQWNIRKISHTGRMSASPVFLSFSFLIVK